MNNLPDDVLRDIVRNESVPLEHRKATLLVMQSTGNKYLNHPDIAAFAAQHKTLAGAQQQELVFPRSQSERIVAPAGAPAKGMN